MLQDFSADSQRHLSQSSSNDGQVRTSLSQSDTTKSPESLSHIGLGRLLPPWVLRWTIDQLVGIPYARWVSQIVDRLLMAIEEGTENV